MTHEENLERKNCPYRTDMGNCLSGGGFCLSVQTDKCRKHIEEALEKVERLEKENKELKEKQIPKKPINETGYYRDNKCPSCLKPIKSGKGSSSHYRNNWCNNCGQHIDWSEV